MRRRKGQSYYEALEEEQRVAVLEQDKTLAAARIRDIGAEGGPPSGAAGGELGGTYPNPTVDGTHSGSAHHAAVTVPDGAHSLSTQVLSAVAAGAAQIGHVSTGAQTLAGAKTFSGGIKTDTISEKTGAVGVTVDTVQIKDNGIVLVEAADHPIAAAATKGQVWVKNAAPNELWFTDDAGTDTQLGVGGGGGDSIEDADADTKIMTEESADEDIIRMDIGDAVAAVPDAFVLNSVGLQLAGVLAAKGATLSATKMVNAAVALGTTNVGTGLDASVSLTASAHVSTLKGVVGNPVLLGATGKLSCIIAGMDFSPSFGCAAESGGDFLSAWAIKAIFACSWQESGNCEVWGGLWTGFAGLSVALGETLTIDTATYLLRLVGGAGTVFGTISVPNHYGVYLEDLNAGFSVTTQYGFYMADQTRGSTNWGFYQTGQTCKNMFNAFTTIGAAAAPATSAVLELQSTTGALLLSRMTDAQRNSLTAVNGMMIYNSTDNVVQAYENGSWVDI